MKIADLETGMNNVMVTGTIREVTDLRDVQTKYGPNTVANALLEDDSGTIKLVLWGKQIDKAKVGTTVEIKGGYVNEWRNEKQLNLSRNAELNVVSGAPEEEEEIIELNEEKIGEE